MSKSKQAKNFINNKAIKNLLSQQNKIKENYENTKNISDNNLMPIKNTDDFFEENSEDIKHTLKELPQYSSLYLKRLEMTKKTLIKESKENWPKIHICKNILDLKGQEELIIIGLTYKDMKLKPSCLKGMENMYGITKVEKYIDEKDNLSLEDTSGRVKIDKTNSKINVNEFVSGIPIALKGKLGDKGAFIVDDYLFYKPDCLINQQNNDTPMDIETNSPYQNKNLILFISNLRIGKPNENKNEDGKLSSARTMLVDFIQNNNLNKTFNDISNRIKRVIFLGGSIYINEKIEELEKGSFIKAEEYKKELNEIIKNYTLLDKYLKIISSYIHVDLINGIEGNDEVYFPQNKNSQLLFLENMSNINAKTLNLVTNPYQFEIYSHKNKSKKSFLGTSGENINCILQYTNINDPLVAMQKTIEWGHLAPLAPDTLRIYPYSQSDPLLLNKIPDVYFISGKNDFKRKVIKYNNKDILLIELPDFSNTSKGIIYNIDDDEINEISFSEQFSFSKK